MTISTHTLTPDTPANPAPVPEVGAYAEPTRQTSELAELVPFDPAAARSSTTVTTALERAGRDDYPTWLAHTAVAGGCSRPVRLAGTVTTLNPATGQVVHQLDTRTLPDAVLYTACGNRRAAVCPSCAELYRQDTYQLIKAGIVGNPDKNLPASLADHPCLFATFTAPSFGRVHSRRVAKGTTGRPSRARRCRPRGDRRCPHGKPAGCNRIHADGDPQLGMPLCLDCYDHDLHVVWHNQASELWRRTRIALDRILDRWSRRHGGPVRLRAEYGKVAEYQTRGAVHFHAIIRLDGYDPHRPDELLPPPDGFDVDQLADAIRHAAGRTRFTTDPHPEHPDGWDIGWGSQLDLRPIRAPGTRQISEEAVAGYLAKYATKATEATGHISQRITLDTIDQYTRTDTHVGRLIEACWRLGRPHGTTIEQLDDWKAGYGRLRRWAHMLGFGGHFTTKSRRYSTTYTAERQRRADWRHARQMSTWPDHDDGDQVDDEPTTLIVGALSYAGIGWRTTGDALLATTAAANARERRRTAREETAHLTAA